MQFGVEIDAAAKRPKTPEYPVCDAETETGKVRVRFSPLNLPGPETGEVEVTIDALANK